MITIEFLKGDSPTKFETLRFSAQEEFVKLQGSIKSITWIYEGDHELMQLALIFDIIHRQEQDKVDLYLPYIPHGRQDRATTSDQPYSLKVFVEQLSFIIRGYVDNIYTVDPHSQVSQKLFEFMGLDLEVTPQHAFAPLIKEFYDFVVAPDKGAIQKTLEWSKALNVPMFACDKVRDPSTGYISSISTPNVDLKGKRVLVCDDLCDGGKTFDLVGLALEKLGCSDMDLFVTHGIFSKGLSPLVRFKDVYTTDSLLHYKKFEGQEKLKVFKWN